MKILDTDLLIEFLRKNQKAVDKVKTLIESGEHISTTVLNAQELLFGFFGECRENYAVANEFLSQLGVVAYRFEDVGKVVQVNHRLAKSGKSIGAHDEIIAGICLSNNATIVTKNEKHFKKVDGLKVEEW